MYKTYLNPYYNPTDTQPRPGENQNWEDIQRGFWRIAQQMDSGAGAMTSIIRVSVDTTGGAITADITNLDDVADILGKVWDHPQVAIVEHVGQAGGYDVYTPVRASWTSATQCTVDFISATVSGNAPVFRKLSLIQMSAGVWVAQFQTFS